jgi:hypothetical protein
MLCLVSSLILKFNSINYRGHVRHKHIGTDTFILMKAFRSYEAFRSNSDAHTKYNIQFVCASGILLTPKSIHLSVHPSPHLYVGMKKTDSLEKLLSLPRELQKYCRHYPQRPTCVSHLKLLLKTKIFVHVKKGLKWRTETSSSGVKWWQVTFCRRCRKPKSTLALRSTNIYGIIYKRWFSNLQKKIPFPLQKFIFSGCLRK